MTEHLKVDELKDLIALVIETVDAAQLIANEGGLSLSDISNMWAVIEKIGPAFRGIGEIPAELADMDVDDCEDVIGFVMSELALESEKSTRIVEKSLRALKASYEVYLEIKA